MAVAISSTLALMEPPGLGAQTSGAGVRGSVFFAVRVRDVEAAEVWYRDVFVLETVSVIDAPDGGFAIRVLSDGAVTVELIEQVETEAPPERHHGLFKVGFRVQDLDAFLDRLRALGIDADVRPFVDEALGVRSFVFRDPEGNRLQVFQACADACAPASR